MATADGQHWMGFNIHAFTKPTTPAEYGALLDEGIRIARQLNEQLESVSDACTRAREDEEYLVKMPANRMPLSFWTHGSQRDKPAD